MSGDGKVSKLTPAAFIPDPTPAKRRRTFAEVFWAVAVAAVATAVAAIVLSGLAWVVVWIWTGIFQLAA